ncbi:MAG: type II secretion system GspH family protein [Lachnospiraceae bacterium]|nr:type II secretion system GspH family protein [Ruminococcus sp.]MCM1276127.1 type II secretion system GspH family protein [Lachnospiraceae bacterium]
MKKLLSLLRRRRNGGFTLTEVIVSCAVLGILVLAVVGLISPVMSVVTSNEKNANAIMLAEAAEAHIDRNIKNAVYCAVFTNAIPNTSHDIMSTELLNSGGAIRTEPAFAEMLDFLKEGKNSEIYDLKIIGIRWMEDKRISQYKYMITDITPKLKDDGTIDTFSEQKAFEDCFYDGFYPGFTFQVLPYFEYPVGGDGKPDTTKEPTDKRNVAIRTIIDVYSNAAMTSVAARGEGYADFINIRTKAINPSNTLKLYSTNSAKDADGNYIGGMEESDTTLYTQLRESDTIGEDIHPETYIVYVTRKLKYFEPTTT